jgi:ribonuclease P protein component|tara:strand:- start:638 stop:1015 length:378 start_codon:yes stop_codon:yes gene_type:complete
MTDFDFSRQRRLLNAGDYRRVFEQAEFKVSDQHLLILARPSLHDHSRLGLVIAKKGIKLAVQRNRIKRIVRDSFRTLCTQSNDFALPLDIVILSRKGLGEIENDAVHRLISKQWARLRKKTAQSD